jgi:prepilin-type N-terminal cleavage/methylation domain-containing protein
MTRADFISSPPRHGFSLLEVLVAMAVLAIMMVFMFNLVAQSTVAWESGSRQIDAAQAARIGLDLMARDLQHAVAAEIPVATPAGGTNRNIAPFFFSANPGAIPGEPAANLKAPPNSAQLFAVAPIAPESATNVPFVEVGFFAVHSARTNGFAVLSGNRYYLLWHSPSLATTGEPIAEIFYRQNANSNWVSKKPDSVNEDGNRMALIDNCYQMQILFATNDASGVLKFTPSWTSQQSLPAGALITLRVMDRKTAARIASLRPTGLTAGDVQTNSTTDAGRVLREGTVEVSRFVPFLNSTN